MYVDDKVVKSPNSEKCMFGLDGGKFLRFILTHRDIEVNPKKFKRGSVP